jgi:hypothetical protein
MDQHPGDDADGEHEPLVPTPEGGPAAGGPPAADSVPDADDVTAEAVERRAARAAAIRGLARREGAVHAGRPREVAGLVEDVTADARLEPAGSRRVAGQPDDSQLIRSAIVGEVVAVMGVRAPHAFPVMPVTRRTGQRDRRRKPARQSASTKPSVLSCRANCVR